jgi:hypothetical protein
MSNDLFWFFLCAHDELGGGEAALADGVGDVAAKLAAEL